jgi:hypothetical protein
VAAVEDAVIVGVVEDLSAEGESNAVVARVAVLSGEAVAEEVAALSEEVVVEDVAALDDETDAAEIAVLSGEEQRFGAKTRHVSRGIFASM